MKLNKTEYKKNLTGLVEQIKSLVLASPFISVAISFILGVACALNPVTSTSAIALTLIILGALWVFAEEDSEDVDSEEKTSQQKDDEIKNDSSE